jgi:hypothetical protein
MKKWFKRIKDYLKPPKVDYRLKVAFQHGDLKLYKFENFGRIPTVRRLAVMAAADGLETKMDRTDLVTGMEKIEEYLNAGNLAAAAQIAGYIKALATYDYNDRLLFNFAAPMILLEGEKPEDNSIEATMKKWQLIENNVYVREFFFSTGYAYLLSFSNGSKLATRCEDYLKKENVRQTTRAFLKKVYTNERAAILKSSILKYTASQNGQVKAIPR